MKKNFTLFAIIFALTNTINAQIVTLTGNAKTYAGDKHVWKTYSDQITFQMQFTPTQP